MQKNAVIVLDPVNLPVMQRRPARLKDFIGGNCTVSLMLMAVSGLLREGLVEWITAMTYQSASGGGAQHMRELLEQMGALHRSAASLLQNPPRIFSISTAPSARRSPAPNSRASSWRRACGESDSLDRQDLGTGQSREEWKAGAEANKIWGPKRTRSRWKVFACGWRHALPFAGAHHQVESRLAAQRNRAAGGRANPWVRVVPNERESSIRELSRQRSAVK